MAFCCIVLPAGEGNCGSKMMKCYFIILNIILTLFGLGAIIAGVVAIQGFTMDEWPQALTDALENEFISSFSLYVIITGSVCFLFGVFGITSATCFKNVLTLYVYCFIIFILGAVQVALGVYIMIAENVLEDLPFIGSDLKTEVDQAIEDSMCTGTFAEITGAQETFNDVFGCNTMELIYEGDDTIDWNEDYYNDIVANDVDAWMLTCEEQAALCSDEVEEYVADKSDLISYVVLAMGGALLIGTIFGAIIAKQNRKAKLHVDL